MLERRRSRKARVAAAPYMVKVIARQPNSLRWRLEVDEEGGTGRAPLEAKGQDGRESHALEYFGREHGPLRHRTNSRGRCFHVIPRRRAWKASVRVSVGARVRPGRQESHSRRSGRWGERRIWGERNGELRRAVSRIGCFVLLHAILHNFCLCSNPVMGQDGTIIVAHPLCPVTNRSPLVGFGGRVLVEPQNMLGVLGPNEGPRIIEDGSGLLLVSVDVVDVFRRRLDGTGGATGDPGGEDGLSGGGHVCDLMGFVQGVAEMIGLGLGPDVKPTNDEGKEVCPRSYDGIARISGDGDEVVESPRTSP
jgi:hypothetical protein